MTPEHEKIWKDACEEAEISIGYLPAELLLLPTLIKMVEEGKIDIADDGENTIIASKGILNKKENK
jgi:hypothetical protein|tara:strand:- start:8959 stop:9156 length:198 start_codon:yes stop_codon:yes gene_type:complete